MTADETESPDIALLRATGWQTDDDGETWVHGKDPTRLSRDMAICLQLRSQGWEHQPTGNAGYWQHRTHRVAPSLAWACKRALEDAQREAAPSRARLQRFAAEHAAGNVDAEGLIRDLRADRGADDLAPQLLQAIVEVHAPLAEPDEIGPACEGGADIIGQFEGLLREDGLLADEPAETPWEPLQTGTVQAIAANLKEMLTAEELAEVLAALQPAPPEEHAAAVETLRLFAAERIEMMQLDDYDEPDAELQRLIDAVDYLNRAIPGPPPSPTVAELLRRLPPGWCATVWHSPDERGLFHTMIVTRPGTTMAHDMGDDPLVALRSVLATLPTLPRPEGK